jgi:hypothetical protein
MHRVCKNPKDTRYFMYGGRGITVCERWQSFENFLEDMGCVPTGMRLSRLDKTGDFTPDNCRWETPKLSFAHKRSPEKFWFEGKERSIVEIADMCGLGRALLRYRLVKKKWPIEKAVLPAWATRRAV